METQIRRLIKVAREFNVEVETIVNCLKQHGYEVAPNPNTIISSDQYDILEKEFEHQHYDESQISSPIHLRLNIPKLQGPTILGTLEVPESGDLPQKSKKKRIRISNSKENDCMEKSGITIRDVLLRRGGDIEEICDCAKQRGVILTKNVNYILSQEELGALDPLLANEIKSIKKSEAQLIDGFKEKDDNDILNYLFDYWKINEIQNKDGSFKVVASYRYEGKDKNGYDYGFFVDIRNLNGDILYYPFRYGPISIYVPHNESYTKEALWLINVRLSTKKKYRESNPFLLELSDKIFGKPKNSFVDRLGKEKLIRELFKKRGATEDDAQTIANALNILIGDVRTDSERFLFELLQNADDQPYNDTPVNVVFKTLSEHLLVLHNGNPFSSEDVQVISNIGDKSSNKINDKEKTGYKGIGFKSVFSDSDTVYIDSGGFSFAFDKHSPVYNKVTDINAIPWQIKPIWQERYRLPKEVAEEQVFFTSRVGIALNAGFENITNYNSIIPHLLKDPRFMLFLRHVESIKFQSDNKNVVATKKTIGEQVVISNDNDNSDWIVKDFEFEIPADIKSKIAVEGSNKIPQKLKNANRTKISFAINFDGNKIEKVEKSLLFTYLPTKVEQFEFPFLINADFIVNSSREYVHEDNVWNKFLFEYIGKKTVEWVKSLSDKYDYLNALPTRLDVSDSQLFLAYCESYNYSLKSDSFILNHKGELAKQDEIIVDKTGLSEIVGAYLFCQLLGTEKSLPSEKINPKILEEEIFESIELLKFDDVMEAVQNNSEFNDWYISASEEQKKALYKWIEDNNINSHKDRLKSFVSNLPLFKFVNDYKSNEEIDSSVYIITTEQIVPIKGVLSKLGFICSDNVFDGKHPLIEFIKPQDKKLLFEKIKKLDFSQLDLTERRELFHVIESDYFDGIGEAKIKELALFKNMNDELRPLCEMVAYEESPNWLKPYVLNREESFDELSKYLIAEEKRFEDIIWKHKAEFPGTPYELYNTYKWTDEKYTRQLISELKETDAFCGLISLVEESSKDTQKYYLQSITKIELLPNAKYGKDSYEYRVLQIALAVYDDPTVFSSKVFYDGQCIKDCSVKDNVVCEYAQNGETKEVCFSLANLLPNYQDKTSSIEQVKLLFDGNGEAIEKFFDLKSKSKFEVYRELKGYLFEEYKYRTNKYSRSYGTYSTTVTEYRWLIIPSIEQYLFVSMYGNNKQLKQGFRLDENDCAKLIDLLYMNGKVQINTVSFVDFYYENHIKNKCFDSDFIFESERLYKTIESWASDESKKQYLIHNGVKTPSSPSIRFRQLFLEDKVIDFIGEIKDEDLATGLEFIATADGYTRPFEGINQEKTLKYLLKEKKCNGLIDKWDLDKMVEVAHEWNSLEYNKWKESHSLQILLCSQKLPHQLFYNNTIVLKYESGHKYYDSSNQRLFISKDNIQKTLLGIIDEQEIPFSSDDYAFLFAVISKDDYDTLKNENERLREEVRKLRLQLDNKTDGTTTLLPDSCSQGIGSVDIEGVNNVPDLGVGSRIDAQIEAQKALRQKAELNNWGWTFPDSFGTEDCYSTFEVQDKNSNPIPIVLKSYKDRSKPFKITPEEWDYIFEYEAEIYVYTSLNGFSCDFVKINKRDLIKGQNVSLQFNVENLEIEDRISSLSESLHYFKELHFNFDNFIVPKNAPTIEDIYNRTNGDKQPETNDDDLK